MEEITKQRVLEELAAIGFARASDFYGWDEGQLRQPIPDRADGAVASIETTGKGIKLKFHDKLKALKLLCELMGLFEAAQPAGERDRSLLEAILQATKKEVAVDDLPELQQAAAAGHELVEQAPAAGP